MEDFKVAFIDMDGVLIEEVSWQVLHDYFGVDNEENLEAFKAGQVSYREFMKRDIELWKKEATQQPTMKNLEKALCRINPRKGSVQLVSAMRKKGYRKIVMISGGINLIAEKIARELHLDRFLANSFKTEQKNGKEIITEPEVSFNFSRKGEIIEDLTKDFGIPLEQVIAIGDSHLDAGMLNKAGRGIAFDPKDEQVQKAADVVVKGNLTDLIQHL